MDLLSQLRRARRVVFFTGAGASTEPPTSLPDFRSATGLWRNQTMMEALTRGNFFRDPEAFWEFFREIFLPWTRAEPNGVHRAPARLAARGVEVGVVTQNIDGLDARCAKGYPVFELHGHLRSSSCPECATTVKLEDYPPKGAPRCACGGVLKPDVVLFDDALDFENTFVPAQELLAQADLILVVGTILTVAPACLLVTERMDQCPTILVNRGPTEYDRRAAQVVRAPAGKFLGAAMDALEERPGATEALERMLAP